MNKQIEPIEYNGEIIWVDTSIDPNFAKDDELFFSISLAEYNNLKHISQESDGLYKIVAQSPNLSIPNIPYVEVEEDNNQSFIDSVWLNTANPNNFSHNSFEFAAKAIIATSTKKYSEEDLRFHATRFAHLCRLHGAVTNNDTINLFDKEYIQSLQPKIKSIEIEMEIDENIEPISTGNYPHKDDYYYKPTTYLKDGKPFLKVKKVNHG